MIHIYSTQKSVCVLVCVYSSSKAKFDILNIQKYLRNIVSIHRQMYSIQIQIHN